MRTFFLLGLLGGAAGFLLRTGWTGAAVTLLLGGVALAVAAYLSAVWLVRTSAAIDGTTEAAALVVLALAVLAGLGHLRLSAATGAVVVLALREKGQIHAWIGKIGAIELRAALQFAVLALVLLPILPEGPYGPLGGVRPRELWMVVVLVSGLNFLGYLAQRGANQTRGSVIAGMLGGLVSSTAVTLSFARASREPDAPRRALALGVVGASTMLFPRVVVLTLALQPRLVLRVALYLLVPFLVGAGLVALSLWRRPAEAAAARPAPGNPLRLGTAILLAVGFQLTLMVMVAVKDRFGGAGVLTSAAILGLTDMEALTFSMARLASQADLVPLGALAIAIGVFSNTLLKCVVALVLGAPVFRREAAVGLGLLAVACLGGILLAR